MPLVGERERELVARVGPVIVHRYDDLVREWRAAWDAEVGGEPPVDLPQITRVAVERGVDEALGVQRQEADRLVAEEVPLDTVLSAVLLWEEAVQRRLARHAVEDIFTGAAAINRLLHRLVLFVAEGYSGVILVGRDAVRRELESADRLKSEIISMVSHDLKTPLTIVEAAAQEMLSAGPELEEDQYRRFCEMILQNAERLSRLISRIVDVSRIESRAVDLNVRGIDPGALVRRVVEGMAPIVPVRLDVPADLPEVLADRDAVERMLVNLIDNAVRFSPDGENVVVDAEMVDGCVEVRVADRGPGVPDDRRHGLFSKFYQVDPSPSGWRSGSGLGLAIVRGLAEAMGGEAGYRENDPTGSVFWFRVPVASVE